MPPLAQVSSAPSQQTETRAEPLWTNLAGQPLRGTPQTLDHDRIRFKTKDGEITVALATFPELEQRKLLIALGQPRLSSTLQRRIGFTQETSRRLTLLEMRKKITTEEADTRRQTLRDSLRKVIMNTSELLPEERDYALSCIP